MNDGIERRWRFLHDGTADRVERAWRWTADGSSDLKIASLQRFATLEACIAHARRSGFSFNQPYDIVFSHAAAHAGKAAV